MERQLRVMSKIAPFASEVSQAEAASQLVELFHRLGFAVIVRDLDSAEVVGASPAAEEAMLALTCERAGVEDGMAILDLGCGWGSLTGWLSERYPNARILAVSNSRAQRELIESRRLRHENVVLRETSAARSFAGIVGRLPTTISNTFEVQSNYIALFAYGLIGVAVIAAITLSTSVVFAFSTACFHMLMPMYAASMGSLVSGLSSAGSDFPCPRMSGRTTR